MDSINRLNAALVGRYHLEREIGAGGMARVYLAQDLRHAREVAVKVLNAEIGLALGTDRFLKEIQLMAGLNHPHLLPLFDSGEADGLLYYVMPFVAGASLRNRLDRERQLPITEAVRITVAVAGALDYAHRHGIVHRDLKPENVLIQDGQPLVADFGIALAISRAGDDRITRTGMAIGTPQYASPEQAAADREIDGRSDIYSLGAVLYEMLTADPPHTASTLQGIIARLMIDRPKDIRTLRQSVPEHVAMAVERALEKLPADRFDTAGEFAACLNEEGNLTPSRGISSGRNRALTQRLRDPLVAGLAALAIVAGAASIWQVMTPPASLEEPVLRFSLDMAEGQVLASGHVGTPFAITDDGSQVAYLITENAQAPQLYLKRLEESEGGGGAIENTNGALQPTFSPSGGMLAFVQRDRLSLLRLDAGSPKPEILASVPRRITGTSWGREQEVVVGQDLGGLYLVPVNGLDARPLTTPDTASGEVSHRWPVMLDDGETILYTSWHGTATTAEIGVTSRSGGETRLLGLKGTFPLGMLGTDLVYADLNGRIMAVAFDRRGRQLAGSPFPLKEQGQLSIAGAEKAALSPSGNLIYQRLQNYEVTLVRLNLSGEVQPFVDIGEGRFADPRLSPNEQQVAVTVTLDTAYAIWVYPTDGSGPPIRLDEEVGNTSRPEWTRDGLSIVYRAERGGELEIYQREIGGSRQRTLLIGKEEQAAEALPHPDGESIVYRRDSESRLGVHLWSKGLGPGTDPRQVFMSNGDELAPAISPDGAWVAFASSKGGGSEVYVAPLPGPGPECKVSEGSGTEPAWSSAGNELYYRDENRFLAVEVRSLADCSFGIPRTLFEEQRIHSDQYHRQFDVMKRGAGFLVLQRKGDRKDVEVVHNLSAQLVTRRGSQD